MMKRHLAALLMASLPALAWGSSDDEWEAFRDAVKQSCRALVDAPDGAAVAVEVSPFGSETYGAALVVVDRPAGVDRMICIFDKATRKAEMAAPFAGAAQ